MRGIRACFPLATAALLAATWLFSWETTSTSLAQTPSTGLTVETFFSAIRGNDTNTVSRMLETEPNLVRAFYYGRVPITVAAGDGSMQMVELLLRKGADVNVQSDTWNTSNAQLTALDAAIWIGHTNLCRLLLEAGANPDLQNVMGESAQNRCFLR